MNNINLMWQAIAAELSRFANGGGFWGLMGEVFGVAQGQAAAHAIQAQLSRGDLSGLARVEVVSAAQLGPARAAYAAANGTIYISDRFLAEASQTQLQAALLEEIGHAIDARVNASDRPGDEGELFALRVRGITPSASERQRILAEDDRRTLTINGISLQVEQAAPVVYETTTVASNAIYVGTPNEAYKYKISGTNAIWVEQRRANRTLRFFNGTSSSIVANSVYSDFGDIAISGATIAYTKSDGQDLEVYRVSAGVTTRLTTNTNEDRNLRIDGNTIVWQTYDASGVGDLYRNNGTTTTRITTNTVEEQDVQLSGNQLLWAASDGNDFEIYINDGTTTRALTNNTSDDYSPVLSGNRAAWFQWNNNQENLFFYDGNTATQITTNLDVSDPLIAGSNLVFKQTDSVGNVSLKFYNAATGITSQLSANLESTQVAASGNLVAWLEPGTNSESNGYGPTLSTLRLFNGTTTTTIATNITEDSGSYDYQTSDRFALRGSKLVYLGKPVNASTYYDRELYLYDAASSAPVSTQLTIDEGAYAIEALGVTGERILWTSGDALKLSQPSTKPILSFANPSLTVVEGFTSPQNATLTVTLSAASSTAVTVQYETATNYSEANSASNFSDYTQTSGTLTFAAGVTSQTINIPILDDSFSETDEKFYLRLSNPSNAVLVPGANSAAITISDTWQVTGPAGSTFTLPANVENLTLTGTTNINGTGNAANNTIRGNSGNNTLVGGGGFDRLEGGAGNDVYTVDYPNYIDFVTIIENANQGLDIVQFSSAVSRSFTLADNVEYLVLTGTGNTSGYGNALDNLIASNSGDNYIDGQDGIDTVSYTGASGPAGVTVSLSDFGAGTATGWGRDTLASIENITGSNFADTLIGNSANNELNGFFGKDTLTGNGGSDRFVYRNLAHSLLANFDRITDFNASSTGDRFVVSSARAGFLAGGAVASLAAADISATLTPLNFAANFAASITLGSGLSTRTFVVINDNTAGFNAATDGVIEVTGFSGTFGTSLFVTG